jgi:hypothetical protein
MSRPKSRQVGTAGLLLRHPDGSCSRGCRRCGEWASAPGWRAGLREARQHAASHAAADARYIDTPWGIPAHEFPATRATRRRRWLDRLAAAVVVLALAALAFSLTVANVSGITGHAGPLGRPPASTTSLPHHPDASTATAAPAASTLAWTMGGDR